MMTLKFIKTEKVDNGNTGYTSDICDAVCCERYTIDQRGPFAIVTVYPKLLQEGVEFQVHSDQYHSAFVENINGKTIGRIGPFN